MSVAFTSGVAPEGRLLAATVLLALYISSLAMLLRWFATSQRSHVLSVEPRCCAHSDTDRASSWQAVYRFGWASAASGVLLVAELTALAFLATFFVPGVQCADGWHVRGCTMDAQSMASLRVDGTPILIGSTGLYLAANRLIRRTAYYPCAVLALGILMFAATTDVLMGVEGPARPQLCFRLAGSLALTAAAAFLLSAVILRPHSMMAHVSAVLAHAMAALVRLLGALALLMLWPYLPPASAIAILLVLLVVPGVATALTAAAVLSIASIDDRRA